MTALRRWYTLVSTTIELPRITGASDVPANRMALLWRPIVDLGQSPYAPQFLRVAEPALTAGKPLWSSRAGATGLRRQVLAHAGLDRLDARDPRQLPDTDRTPAWQALCDRLDRYADLDTLSRAAVVFVLVQLSFCGLAIRLASTDTAEPVIFQVGRALGRTGQADAAVTLYRRLAATTTDPAMRANAVFQSGGYGLRRAGTTMEPAEAAQMEQAATTRPETWAEALGLSRLCRLAAITAKEPARAAQHLDDAYRQAEAARGLFGDDLTLAENDRQLLDTELDVALLGGVTCAAVNKYAAAAGAYDPHCIDHLTRLGLAEAALGDYAAAADRFGAAGLLGTLDGAAAWYLAGQCFDRLDRRDRAVHAMGRCLELDPAAAEPRDYLIDRRKG